MTKMEVYEMCTCDFPCNRKQLRKIEGRIANLDFFKEIKEEIIKKLKEKKEVK